jgi:plastocyanin
MTDTPVEEAEATGDAETAETAEVEPTSGDVAAPAAEEKAPFWHRPLVERFLVPLVLPLVVVVGIVVYVLNVSRMFLSAHGHIPVIVGTVITFAILLGAAWLSAIPRLRPTSVVLLTAGFLFVMMIGGWITLGASESDEEELQTLPTDLKTTQEQAIVGAPGGAFAFDPSDIEASTGLATFNVDFAAPGHNFTWRDAETLMAPLEGTGETSGVAFFGDAGEYEFFCSVPGHDAAGMHGVATIEGDTVTLDQALADAGNEPGAVEGAEG